MSSRFETITDDNLLQALLTQPGMVYLDGQAIGLPKSFRRHSSVPHPHGWLAPGMRAPRLARLKQGYFVVLVEEDEE